MNEPNSNSFIFSNPDREWRRKLLHVPVLLLPFCYALFPIVTITLIFLVSLAYIFSERQRRLGKKELPWIGKISQQLTRSGQFDLAPLYLAMGCIMTLTLFPLEPAFVGMLLVGICDSLAAVVGMRWGHRKLYGNKSYVGTLVFFSSALILLGFLLEFPTAFLIAVIATFLEIMSKHGLDNLILPLAGAALVQLFHNL